MVKFRLYFDKDKETAFLNGMSERGYALTGFFMGFYYFDSCVPGEYIYQIDITEGMFHVSSDYREFMRDMGVEIVTLWGPWVIMRKKASEGAFELYTDAESCIAHYTRIRNLFKGVVIVEVIALTIELWGTLEGVASAKWLFLLLLVLLFALLRHVAHVNRILAQLKEKSGKAVSGTGRSGKVSFFLPAGLLLNGIVLLLPQEDMGESWIICSASCQVSGVCWQFSL